MIRTIYMYRNKILCICYYLFSFWRCSATLVVERLLLLLVFLQRNLLPVLVLARASTCRANKATVLELLRLQCTSTVPLSKSATSTVSVL